MSAATQVSGDTLLLVLTRRHTGFFHPPALAGGGSRDVGDHGHTAREETAVVKGTR